MVTCEGSIRTNCSRISTLALLLVAAAILAGCHGTVTPVSGGQVATASVTMSMTSVGDTPPTGLSVFSLQLTITDARLNPGNVEALSGPVTVDLARLRTENALLSALNVVPGTYTSVTITVAQSAPLTYENSTGSTLTVGGTQCANGAICTASLAVTSGSQSVSLPAGGVTANSATSTALIIDLNLTDLLANTAGTLSMNLGASGAISAAQLTSSGAPFETVEDVVGVVGAPANNAFTLQTALGTYSLSVNSTTQFVNFPTTVCTSAGFACLASGEIVSANMSLQTSNTLVATDVFYEDTGSSVPEVEGVVVGISGLPTQFNMVVLQATPAGSGSALGSNVTVAINSAPFAIDNLVGTVNTSTFSFSSSAMIVGQEVQVQQGTGSTSSLINANRVLLRNSRITGVVANTAFPNFTLNQLPRFLQNASPAITQIQVQTATTFTPNATEFAGSISNLTQIQVGRSLSARGQLFANGGFPTMLATRVVEH